MNFLTVFCLAVVAGCSSAQLLRYPGVYGGFPGVYLGNKLGGYVTSYGAVSPLMRYGAPYAVPAQTITVDAEAVTLKSITPEPITIKTITPEPITLNTGYPLTYQMGSYAPVAPIMSQFRSQDEIGQYAFGYAGGASSRAESRDVYGIVRGSYNYIDGEGQVQTQHYVADGLGFRVSGTNLPVAPEAPEAALPGPIPEPVEDTAEVAEAKAAFKAAYDETAAAAAAAPDSRKKRSVMMAPAVTPYSAHQFAYRFPMPYAYQGMLGSPLPYAAATYATAPIATTYAAAVPAATMDAELLRVVHNPGHAVSYRVQ